MILLRGKQTPREIHDKQKQADDSVLKAYCWSRPRGNRELAASCEHGRFLAGDLRMFMHNSNLLSFA